MSYLFIDSTYDLILGVLDDGLNWLSFERVTGIKASTVIQSRSQELLLNHNLDAQDLKGVITVNGPGFYTGLRLAEGVADVFEFFGVKKYSFYSYEIPLWCGEDKGHWFTKAYRGEYFIYSWDKSKSEKHLYSAKELPSIITEKRYFIHSETSLDQVSTALIEDPVHTVEMLRNYPQKIFSEAMKGPFREPFYFRAPEDEFKANP